VAPPFDQREDAAMQRRLTTISLLLTACGCGSGDGNGDAVGRGAGRLEFTAPIAIADVAGAPISAAAQVATSVDAATRIGARFATASKRPKLVVLADGRTATDSLLATADALVVPDDGIAAAVDLALLWSHGTAPPSRLPLGAQIITAADQAAGGHRRPAPGDLVLQVLRGQHAELLTTTPAIDVVFRVAFVGSSPATVALRPKVAAAVKRYPQLELSAEPGGAIAPVELAATIEALGKRGCRAALIAVDPAGEVLPAAAKGAADKAQLALLLLDPLLRAQPAHAVIHGDPEIAGRAVADTLRQLLPAGGQVMEVIDPATRAFTDAARAGWTAAIDGTAHK
jgi:hypothetical protein